MGTTKKAYTATFKAQVVQQLLTEGQQLNQIATECGIHPRWAQEWTDYRTENMFPLQYCFIQQGKAHVARHHLAVGLLFGANFPVWCRIYPRLRLPLRIADCAPPHPVGRLRAGRIGGA